MFERFTDRARKVMALANQEAQLLNHEYVGTEHILLGLVKEGSGVGATVLKNLDVDIKKLRLEVKKLVKSNSDMVTMGKLPPMPGAKKVIEYAIEEARSLNHKYVGTEHILLGLLRESKEIAAQVLMNLGLKLEDVRQEVLNLLRTGVDDGPTLEIRTIPITEEILIKMKQVIKASLAYEDAIGGIRKTGITAEVGEIYACYHLKLRLCADPKAKGFDAIDQQGRQVQIKTRRSETMGLPSDLGRLSSFSKHHFDYVVLVILNPDYSLAEMWRAEYIDVLPLIEKHKRRNPNLSSFKKVARRIKPEFCWHHGDLERLRQCPDKGYCDLRGGERGIRWYNIRHRLYIGMPVRFSVKVNLKRKVVAFGTIQSKPYDLFAQKGIKPVHPDWPAAVDICSICWRDGGDCNSLPRRGSHRL